jgi:hypothetical protein
MSYDPRNVVLVGTDVVLPIRETSDLERNDGVWRDAVVDTIECNSLELDAVAWREERAAAACECPIEGVIGLLLGEARREEEKGEGEEGTKGSDHRGHE